jgi:vacuolar-type H+-ATPase subunit E/Vma4
MSIRDEEKIRRFTDEVFEEAESIAEKMNAETDAEEALRLKEGENKILAEAYDLIQNEIKNINRENSQILSQEIMKTRRELLLYREEIMHRVFERAREKINVFTSSDEYGKYLVKLCVDVLRRQDSSFTIYLSPRDMALKYQILQALDNMLDEKFESGTTKAAPVFSIMPDRNIKLGGARFYSTARGISINATFDENLIHQKEYFTELLGSIITEL